ncbi:Flp pilus assembly protein CpaB [Enorma sp.]|uniref:Flp pilus assembly protein CpaB n=1 Tax=Enorma sp. TaxID=1920692 RepID=UPI0025C1D012|nr:Flp pilus assembly protein CpaB [Enorma sp.]
MKRGVRLAISVASGILAFALASWYGASIRAEAARERQELLAAYGGDVVSVCVATRDVDAGELIDEGDIELTEWVAGLLPADSATSIDEVVGKRATSNIPARAVLCPAYFQERGGTLEVPEGMVAVSVPVDSAHAVGGTLACGDTVDVYLAGTGIADRVCRAQVIATSADETGGTSVDLSWVTVAVAPDRVSELLAATAKGSVSLVVPGSDVEGLDEEASSDADEARETERSEVVTGVASDGEAATQETKPAGNASSAPGEDAADSGDATDMEAESGGDAE